MRTLLFSVLGLFFIQKISAQNDASSPNGAGFQPVKQPSFANIPYPFNIFKNDPFGEPLIAQSEAATIPPGIDLPPELMDLYSKFAHLLPQLAEAHQNSIKHIDYCNPEKPNEGRKYYCRGLTNGFYHDPWNPWCGYIECLNDETYRIGCRNHTFVDIMSKPTMSQKSLCRKSLETVVGWKGQCPHFNEGDICARARNVEADNPPYPNRKETEDVDVTASPPPSTSPNL